MWPPPLLRAPVPTCEREAPRCLFGWGVRLWEPSALMAERIVSRECACAFCTSWVLARLALPPCSSLSPPRVLHMMLLCVVGVWRHVLSAPTRFSI